MLWTCIVEAVSAAISPEAAEPLPAPPAGAAAAPDDPAAAGALLAAELLEPPELPLQAASAAVARTAVAASSAREGEMVLVSVADDGPGVAEEDRDRVFEPFFRAPSQRQRDDGSGLGLAIVREIARVHGGDVIVDDRPGGPGARFRARLPAAPL